MFNDLLNDAHFMQANSINEVIICLDKIIRYCEEKSSRTGYFASLYKAMTLGVQTGIEQKVFEDSARMERLDVAFANRYLDAYNMYISDRQPTHSWMYAFKASEQMNLTVVQHLLLGINAHINLDLGIATASISTPDNLESMHHDYNQINEIIANVYNSMDKALRKIAWPAVFLRPFDMGGTNSVINFSMQKARDTAWNNAKLLVGMSSGIEDQVIRNTDSVISKVATAIQNPGGIIKWLTRSILLFESKDVTGNIMALNERS